MKTCILCGGPLDESDYDCMHPDCVEQYIESYVLASDEAAAEEDAAWEAEFGPSLDELDKEYEEEDYE